MLDYRNNLQYMYVPSKNIRYWKWSSFFSFSSCLNQPCQNCCTVTVLGLDNEVLVVMISTQFDSYNFVFLLTLITKRRWQKKLRIKLSCIKFIVTPPFYSNTTMTIRTLSCSSSKIADEHTHCFYRVKNGIELSLTIIWRNFLLFG